MSHESNVIDLNWHRRHASWRTSSKERFEQMLAEEKEPWIPDRLFAEHLELSLPVIRRLMREGWPHDKVGRTYLSKPFTSAAWWRECRPREIVEIARRPHIPHATRQAVYDRDGRKCAKCGSEDNLSLDHVQPYSRGGSDSEDNLQTLCMPCNISKRDSWDEP